MFNERGNADAHDGDNDGNAASCMLHAALLGGRVGVPVARPLTPSVAVLPIELVRSRAEVSPEDRPVWSWCVLFLGGGRRPHRRAVSFQCRLRRHRRCRKRGLPAVVECEIVCGSL